MFLLPSPEQIGDPLAIHPEHAISRSVLAYTPRSTSTRYSAIPYAGNAYSATSSLHRINNATETRLSA
jgi:hypothetical protein